MSDLVMLNSIAFAIALIGIILLCVNIYSQSRTSQYIKQAELNIENNPDKTRPVWDLARATLEAYFSRNLIQITSIFWLSVFVFICGFIIILFGVSQAIQNHNMPVVSGIATLAGIITEFVGATFLFIYRSTIKQATNYSRTLERINCVGMAMQILDTIPAEAKSDDLKSKTKATLVELLVRQTYEIPQNPPEEIRDKNK